MPPIGIGLPPPELEDIQIAEATYSAAMKIVLERDALKKDDLKWTPEIGPNVKV
jgi:hypothetical protein